MIFIKIKLTPSQLAMLKLAAFDLLAQQPRYPYDVSVFEDAKKFLRELNKLNIK